MKLSTTAEELSKILMEKGYLKSPIKWSDNYKIEFQLNAQKGEDTPNFANNQGRKPCALNKVQREKLQRMKQDGMSNRKIAKVLGVSEGTVRNELKRVSI